MGYGDREGGRGGGGGRSGGGFRPRNNFGGGGGGDFGSQFRERTMHKVTCSECGVETEVPFEPKAGRPVYCRDCYRKKKAF